ncbi:MAG TPA: TetR/AcrR family transcriptional regulator [Halanaerobiales bacterium]|nr:TetR/AcrR family transcriptional regulator [Halanaerobiales bacterium]
MKKSEKTKQRILNETIKLMSKKGYASTSTQEIAKNANISEATIYKYYKNKDNLLKTIVINTIEKLFESSSQEKIPKVIYKNIDKEPKLLLASLINERLNFFDSHKKELKVIFQEMLINKKVQKYFKNEIWSKMVKVSDEIFNQIKKQSKLKDDIDGYMFRKSLFGMIFFTIIFEEILEENQEMNNNKQAVLFSEMIFDGIISKK